MKIVIFTSNAIRHRYVANQLAQTANDSLIVSECTITDSANQTSSPDSLSLIDHHFQLRFKTEQKFFSGNEYFQGKVLPILYKEVNQPWIYDVIRNFRPDLMFVFGASIIRDPLLSMLEPGRFVNLHLGLSPYYRGSGTNFWPFVNGEPEYVGSTILHIDAGIDTGDIITHIRPKLSAEDTVHTAGCKVIQESVNALLEIMKIVSRGEKLPRVKQWRIEGERYYKTADFNENILKTYYSNLEDGLMQKFVNNPVQTFKLVSI